MYEYYNEDEYIDEFEEDNDDENKVVLVNFVITAYDDWNYEFTRNKIYDGKLLDGGLKWLIEQQGYSAEEFEEDLLNASFRNDFFKSVYNEIINTTTQMNALVASFKISLANFNKLREIRERETKPIELPKKSKIGLVDFWQGAGSMLGIKLEKDLLLPHENINDIDIDENFNYSICEIYGLDISDY